MKRYSFVVDTNQYAGNFEREMAYYMTGLELAPLPGGIQWLQDLVTDTVFDDEFHDRYMDYRYGEHGPAAVEIAETPRLKGPQGPPYNSVAIYLREVPPDDVLEVLKRRAYRFAELQQVKGYQIEILGFRLLTETSRTTTKAI